MYFTGIWYIFGRLVFLLRFGMVCQEKSSRSAVKAGQLMACFKQIAIVG
jgi:hypothetical protein